MTRKHIFVSAGIAVIVIAAAVTVLTVNNKNLQANNKQSSSTSVSNSLKTNNKQQNCFLTVVTCDLNNMMKYYRYNPLTGEKKLLMKLPEECFPTATVSNDGKTLYYTFNADNNKSVELFRRNLDTGKVKQLTNLKDNIYNVDDLYPDYQHDQLYLRVQETNEESFKIAKYNIKNNKVTILNKSNNDLSDQSFDYCPGTNKLFTVEHSQSEDDKIMDEKNKTQRFGKIASYSCLLKDTQGNVIKKLFTMNRYIGNTQISADGKHILYQVSTENTKGDTDLKVIYQDTGTNNSKVLYSEGFDGTKEIPQLGLTPDGKRAYLIMSVDSKYNSQKLMYGLFYIDIDNPSIKKSLVFDKETVLSFTLEE